MSRSVVSEVIAWQQLAGVVVVQLQQQRVGDVDLEVAQVLEGLAELLVGLPAERHGAVVAGVGLDVGHQGIDAG